MVSTLQISVTFLRIVISNFARTPGHADTLLHAAVSSTFCRVHVQQEGAVGVSRHHGDGQRAVGAGVVQPGLLRHRLCRALQGHPVPRQGQ